jgi:hypothetical protein
LEKVNINCLFGGWMDGWMDGWMGLPTIYKNFEIFRTFLLFKSNFHLIVQRNFIDFI